MAKKPAPNNFLKSGNTTSQSDVRANSARGLDVGGVPFGAGGKQRPVKQLNKTAATKQQSAINKAGRQRALAKMTNKIGK